MRRWQTQKDSYDIIIFSDTIYKIVKNNLPALDQSDLWKQSLIYNPIIKKHYQKMKFPHNVVYFFHALTGFLWNPQNMSLAPQDSIYEIFKKANGKYIVIIDDMVEAELLIKAASSNLSQKFDFSFLQEISKSSNIYITNNYTQIYQKPKFAFSFSWSGASIGAIMESNNNFKFLIHPKLSYITSDLLAQNSSDGKTSCIAKFITNKSTASFLQNKLYYFSPYTDNSAATNPTYKYMYDNFIHLLPNLSWKKPIDVHEFYKIGATWQQIKLSLRKHPEV